MMNGQTLYEPASPAKRAGLLSQLRTNLINFKQRRGL